MLISFKLPEKITPSKITNGAFEADNERCPLTNTLGVPPAVATAPTLTPGVPCNADKALTFVIVDKGEPSKFILRTVPVKSFFFCEP